MSKEQKHQDLAGIDKVDERGETLNVHALRHSFGTFLSRP